jgi:hypothetical protein
MVSLMSLLDALEVGFETIEADGMLPSTEEVRECASKVIQGFFSKLTRSESEPA